MTPELPRPADLPLADTDDWLDMSAPVSLPPCVDDDDKLVGQTNYVYPDGAKNTYRLSGPWGDHFPGDKRRRFKTAAMAYLWATLSYRHRGPVKRIRDGEDKGVWIVEVRKP